MKIKSTIPLSNKLLVGELYDLTGYLNHYFIPDTTDGDSLCDWPGDWPETERQIGIFLGFTYEEFIQNDRFPNNSKFNGSYYYHLGFLIGGNVHILHGHYRNSQEIIKEFKLMSAGGCYA